MRPPSHLAERIRASRATLEGERKQVTVLFADLKGSLEAISDLDPEEAREVIDPILEKMMDAVHRYEGTVNQVLGDGIMALFGAPLSHEDHAVRACYAALAMQAAILKLNEQTRLSHGVELQIRVGINSGEVVVRALDSDLSLEYSAVGLTTHLAARMEQLAAPGTIRMTPHTLSLAEGFVLATSLGPTRVKGLDEPIEVFELTGVSTLRTRVQVAAPRGLTRFVGRNTEIEILAKTVERASSGRGEIVALVGEAGVGKSRLVWEFTRSHRLQSWSVLESASVSYGKASAYKPLIDLLKNYFQVDDADNARRIREKVTGKLLALDRGFEPLLPAFLSLLDVPFENPEWQSLVPALRRTRTLDACKRLIVRESQLQPLVLVFEDLHWVDAETQAFLDSMVDSLATARILLLVNYRPEYSHDWTGKTFYAQLRIDPLTSESSHELLDALLGREAGLAGLRELLIERTQGNPFFIEECVRTLFETGALKGERGNYRLAAPLSEALVPQRVQSILAARIDSRSHLQRHAAGAQA
ncbi:MAG: AAA family ATPase [Burkholderiales bacterium]